MFSAEKHARLVEQHRLEVAQLKREASIHRIKVIKVDIIFKPKGGFFDFKGLLFLFQGHFCLSLI